MRGSVTILAPMLAAVLAACAGTTSVPGRSADATASASESPPSAYAFAPEQPAPLRKQDTTVFDRAAWTEVDTVNAIHTGGTRSPDEVRRAVARRAARIHRCYDLALASDPHTAGKLVVRWRVSARGAVTRARVVESTVRVPALHACVLREIGHLQFAPSPTGASDDVEIPLVFSARTSGGRCGAKSPPPCR